MIYHGSRTTCLKCRSWFRTWVAPSLAVVSTVASSLEVQMFSRSWHHWHQPPRADGRQGWGLQEPGWSWKVQWTLTTDGQVAEKNAAQVAKMVEGHMNPLNAYLNTMHVKTDVPPTRFSCFSCFGDGFRQWVKFRFQKRGCLRGGLGFEFMTVHPSEVHRFDFFTYVNCCLWYPPIAKIWWVNRRSLLAFYVFMFVSTCFTVEDHCSIAETLLSEMCTKHCKAIGPPQKSIMAQYTWKAPKKSQNRK